MPPDGIKKIERRDVLSFEEMLRFIRGVKSQFTLSKVHITGGEPLIRSGIVGFVEELANEGLPDLAMTTNGQRLADMAADLKRAGLQRVNISLDSLRADRYQTLTRTGRLSPVLRGIDAAITHGLSPVKINSVILKGVNDDEVVDIARFALEHGCQVRFLELMPIGCAAAPAYADRFVDSLTVRRRLEEVLQLRPLPRRPGVSSRSFVAKDPQGRQGIVGFISPNTSPFCGDCNRLRLTSEGRLIACLARGTGPRIRDLLRDQSAAARQQLVELIEQHLAAKCGRAGYDTPRFMAAVGG